MGQPEHVTHHWICVEDVDLDLILTFDPDDLGGTTAERLAAYRKWAESVKDVIEDGLETA